MMNRLLILLVYGFVLLLPIGCRSPSENSSSVKVIIDGGGQFPKSLVGRWKADEGGWEFVLEQDGTISSAVISLGRVRLRPGQTTIVPMKLGGEGVFKPGPWTVQYSYETRELVVEITIEEFRVELGEDTLQGKSRDFFIGQISEDNQFWLVDRFSFPEYSVDTNEYRNYTLPIDPNQTPPESLVFQRVAELE